MVFWIGEVIYRLFGCVVLNYLLGILKVRIRKGFLVGLGCGFVIWVF